MTTLKNFENYNFNLKVNNSKNMDSKIFNFKDKL